MSKQDVVDQLCQVLNADLDDVKELSLEATNNYPDIQKELFEASRRLNLALNRELMDDYQVKLAYRVSVKKIVKRLKEEEQEQTSKGQTLS